MLTHTFKLLSGPECEIKEMTGKHQRILSEGTDSFQAKLNKMLKDLIVRIGSVTDITEDVMIELLSGDRKKMLTEARQFTLNYDPLFKFNFEYEDGNKKMSEPMEIDLSEGIPEKPYYQTWNELSDIDKQVIITLPRCNKKVRFQMLTCKMENWGASQDKETISMHTPILMRNPQWINESEKGNPVPIKMDQKDLDNMSYLDIETLRASIKKFEGGVDTELMIKHPKTKEDVIVDILNTKSFFFPSEVM